MHSNHKLNQKLQVLLTKDEVEELNRIILEEALYNKKKPMSISSYIRKLIQREIVNNQNQNQNNQN